MGYSTLFAVLSPLLLLQGRYVRHVTVRLPEPPGPRTGDVGTGARLRVLIVGDSAAVDGRHPGPRGYHQWSIELAKRIRVRSDDESAARHSDDI